MKPLSRRSVIAGSAAAVAAIPVIELSLLKSNARARFEHHLAEMQKAMGDYYGADVEVIAYGGTIEEMPEGQLSRP